MNVRDSIGNSRTDCEGHVEIRHNAIESLRGARIAGNNLREICRTVRKISRDIQCCPDTFGAWCANGRRQPGVRVLQ